MSPSITHGNIRLAFEPGEDGAFIPRAYADLPGGESLVLEGDPFLSITVGDRTVPARITRASAGDTADFAAEFVELGDWQVTGRVVPAGDKAERLDWRLQIAYTGDEPAICAFHVAFRVADTGVPRWMAPGMFYNHNRPENCARRYPRYSPDDGSHDEFVSSHWSFRADRCSCPGIFCWTDNLSSALVTPPGFSHGEAGVGFRGDADGTFLYLNYPWVESPVKYSFCRNDGQSPEALAVPVMSMETVGIAFGMSAGGRDLHSYDPVIRDVYNASEAEPNPWVSAREAEELLAYGLYRWHYDPQHAVIYETCAFDGYFGKGTGQVDRPHMHVAWVSGAPYAFVLLRYGRENGIPECEKAGLSVLDKIAGEGISPCGLFYPEWTAEKGWGTGWNPRPEWIQARTVAEATWFFARAALYAREAGIERAEWEQAVRTNLDFAAGIQRSDGNFGSYYNIETGQCEEWDGCGGIMWIAALLAGASAFDDPLYRDAAARAGEYYASFIEDEYVYGAPEDVHLTPTSEDAYSALIAYVHLYEDKKHERWLGLAKRSADLACTFRFTYNAHFEEETILGRYDYRTFGADIASPANNHLHNYGLICHPEMLRLWEYTGDTYYLSRAADHLACFHQFIARADGDFNARRGMMSEQWFHTDWTHPKGSMLQLAHSWCAGLVLYADLYTHEYGDIIIDRESREVYVLDNSWIESTEDVDGDLVLTIVNPSPRDQTLSVRQSGRGIVGSVHLPALGESRVRIYARESRIEELAGEGELWN